MASSPPPPTFIKAPEPQRVGPSFEEQLALQQQAQTEAKRLALEQAAEARRTEQEAYARAQKTGSEIAQLTGKSVEQISRGAEAEYKTTVPAVTELYQAKLASYDPSAELQGYTAAAQRGIRGATQDITQQFQQATAGYGGLIAAGGAKAGQELRDISKLGEAQQTSAFLGGVQAQQTAAEQTSQQQQRALQRGEQLQQRAFRTFQTAAQKAGKQGERQMMAMTRKISNLYNPDYLRIATKPPTQRSTLLEETMSKQLYNI